MSMFLIPEDCPKKVVSKHPKYTRQGSSTHSISDATQVTYRLSHASSSSPLAAMSDRTASCAWNAMAQVQLKEHHAKKALRQQQQQHTHTHNTHTNTHIHIHV
jgi:hypothetical protein